jgi:5-methyltetrahydrofolate--homocysteine methyltransferase
MKLLDIIKELNKRILVLDGATGTMIQKYRLSENDFRGSIFRNHKKDLKGNNDILCLTQPEIIAEIHKEYLEAGADIIETNTFNANRISQSDYQTEDSAYEINFSAAKIAKAQADIFSKKNADKQRFVAGSVGPTNRTLSMSPDVNNPGYRNISFDELKDAYYEQIAGLIEGGADIILIETIFDTLNAKSAIYAVSEYFKKNNVVLPVMLSGTIIDKSGRTLSGQMLDAFLISVAHTPNLLSLGLNCSLGSEDMRQYIKEISEKVNIYTSLYPNAGLPNEFGEYDESPEYMAKYAQEYSKNGYVNIIGGCCGTTPEHIKAFVDAVHNIKPRKVNYEYNKIR